MALDPNISLGVRPLQIADPLAQYGQVATIQNAQNQNALAQYQLGSAQRAEKTQNVLSDAYSQSISPEGTVDYKKLTGLLAAGGGGAQIPAIEKMRREIELSALTQQETAFKVQKQKNDFLAQAKRDTSNNPSDANLTAFGEDLEANPLFSKIEKAQMAANVNRILAMPFDQRRSFMASQGATASDLKPTVTNQNLGGTVRAISTAPFGGAATVVPGSIGSVTSTPAQLEQNRIAQARLNFEQSKFAYEKANPGYELKEAEDGSIVGVNKRTLQAFPVSIGGGAGPAAAPVVGGAGGTGMPGARAAVPGAAPAALPGAEPTAAARPLMGKATALTESQGNATAYGMRMFDSNKLLKDLETAGTTSGGRIRGAVEGTLTSLIPYQGANLAEGAGAIMNALPGVLGGPNEQQQSYDAAKRNFITAVLRKESGAAIGASEFANEDKKYFPQAGESKKIIEQKQKARDLAIKAMKIQAGPGAKNIGVGGAGGGTPSASDPLGLGTGGT